MKLLPAWAAAFLALAPTAHAATIFASGKLYGSSNQNLAVCYLFNAGSQTVQIFSSAINDESGNDNETENNCGGALAPGAGCVVASFYIGGGTAYDCALTVNSTAGLRGSLEMRQDSTTLQSQSLR
jgi:hypothetical protein